MSPAVIIALINVITTLTPLLIEAIQRSRELTAEDKQKRLDELIRSTSALAAAIAAYEPLPRPEPEV